MKNHQMRITVAFFMNQEVLTYFHILICGKEMTPANSMYRLTNLRYYRLISIEAGRIHTYSKSKLRINSSKCNILSLKSNQVSYGSSNSSQRSKGGPLCRSLLAATLLSLGFLKRKKFTMTEYYRDFIEVFLHDWTGDLCTNLMKVV
jgi:hypothetical protein